MKKPSKKYNKPNILIIGPYSPPIGGVATVLKNLSEQEEVQKKYNLNLYRTGKESEKISVLIQSIKDFYKIIWFFITLKFINVDIFHIHTSSYFSFLRNIPYVLISKYISKGKIILHIHGGKFHLFYNTASKPLKKIIKYILGSSDSIIVTSQSWIEVLSRICDKHVKIFSIPNGFDTSLFFPTSKREARENLGLLKDKKIFVTIGSLEICKGHRYLIESMKNIIRSRNDVILYIIGSGLLKKEINLLINKYELSDSVFLLEGDKSPREIAIWFNACDIFILPSLNEANPTVMFECLACGKPFVGTKVGGIPDIITSEEYGLLCNPSDSNDLMQKILISLNKKWNHKKINAYAQQFTWKNNAEKLAKIYDINL